MIEAKDTVVYYNLIIIITLAGNKIISIKKLIKSLRDQINKHNINYYVNDNPTISDYEYDILFKKLINLEIDYPNLIIPTSPTQRIGANPLPSFKSINHTLPMLSLDNAMSEEEIIDFDMKLKKGLGVESEIEYIAEPKLDGLAVELVYNNGEFIIGSTRGDGYKGENIFQNLKTIKSIPLKILTSENLPLKLELRGEVFINKKDFKILNEQKIKNGYSPFANPRNCAAGSLRQLNSAITAERPLQIYLYGFGYVSNNIFKTQKDFLTILSEWGFPVNPLIDVGNGPKFLINYKNKMENIRNQLDYEIDGIVCKVNDTSLQKLLGEKSRSPKWAIAGKFKAQQVTTIIKNIFPSLGRTGAVTPVAQLQPVEVGGVIVSNATLHNQDEIDKKDIRIGDTVLIQRAGDVIPKVVKVIIDKRPKNSSRYKLPNICPVCNHKIKKSYEKSVARCINDHCKARIKGNIKHFISKHALDIEGFGDKLVDQLVEKELINNIADIFTLNKKDLISLDRMGDKSANNLILEINKSKNTTLSKFIFGLGIMNVGQNASWILEKYYLGDINKIISATSIELQNIHEIGTIMAESIITFFKNKQNIRIIKKCINSGIIFSDINNIIKSTLTGYIFVITGTLNKLSRKEAKEMIEKLGGRVNNTISKKTNFLIAGHASGSKLNKAKMMDIKIITETELMELIK